MIGLNIVLVAQVFVLFALVCYERTVSYYRFSIFLSKLEKILFVCIIVACIAIIITVSMIMQWS